MRELSAVSGIQRKFGLLFNTTHDKYSCWTDYKTTKILNILKAARTDIATEEALSSETSCCVSVKGLGSSQWETSDQSSGVERVCACVVWARGTGWKHKQWWILGSKILKLLYCTRSRTNRLVHVSLTGVFGGFSVFSLPVKNSFAWLNCAVVSAQRMLER